MKEICKLSFLFLFLVAINTNVFAQTTTLENSIVIKNNSHPERVQFYSNAIYSSEMENFRLREKDVILKFSEGFECVMLSAKTLKEKGAKIDLNNYQLDFIPKFILPTFSITQTGTLIANYEKVVK